MTTNIRDPLFVEEEIPIRNERVRTLKIRILTGRSFENEKDLRLQSGFQSYLLKFDRSGNRTQQQKYNREGHKIQEWIYDSRGKLLREVTYDTAGRISNRFEYVYDQKGNWKEKLMYLEDDMLNYRIAANRDGDGRILESIYYDSSGKRIRTDSYIYNNHGRLVRLSMGHMGEWIYEYDRNFYLKRKSGNLPSASAFGENYEFEYNDRGLLIRMNHLHYNITIFEYTFFK